MAKASTKIPANDDEAYYKAQSDAESLQKAAEIEADPDRHAAAKDHLDKKSGAIQNATAQAQSVAAKHQDGTDDDTESSTKPATGKVNLRKKIKEGMGKAFPRD